ncbi:MAG: RING finger protein [Candidatus Helarchaeota archaeon]
MLFFVPYVGYFIEIPIDIMLIAFCYIYYGRIALILCLELVPFLDLFPIFFFFAILVILGNSYKKDDSTSDKVVVKSLKSEKKKKSKYPTCIICLDDVKSNQFNCICGSIFHKSCFFDFAVKHGCPSCGRPLDYILKKKGIKSKI